MLAAASTWLDSTLKTSEGETVTIKVGGDEVDVTAVVGATPIGVDFGNGVFQTWQSTDFLIEASELVAGGVSFLPEPGMAFVRTIGGDEKRFEVMPADDGRVFRYTDPGRAMLRIHTKEVPA